MKILNNEDIQKITEEEDNIREMIKEIDIAISRLMLTKEILISHQLKIEKLTK